MDHKILKSVMNILNLTSTSKSLSLTSQAANNKYRDLQKAFNSIFRTKTTHLTVDEHINSNFSAAHITIKWKNAIYG